MKLDDWIKSMGGCSAVARKLKISRESVHNWYYKRATPRYEMMKRLIELSGDKVTMQEIVRYTNEGKAR